MRTQVDFSLMTAREQRNYMWKLRRQRTIRNRLVLLFLTIFLIIGCTVSYHAIVSKAESSMEELSFKYYSSIVVESGDSLWTIAEEYMDEHYDSTQSYIAEVQHINHLSNDTIKAGQCLIIPYYSNEFVK